MVDIKVPLDSVADRKPQKAPKEVPQRTHAKPGSRTDFIAAYVKYADVLEVPAMAHEAVAISLIAAVLNRNNVYFSDGPIKVPLDLWVSLISESSLGRNTLVTLMRQLLSMDEGSFSKFIVDVDFGSPQAVQQRLAEHSKGFFVWPELSAVLQKLSSPKFASLKTWLTNLFDEYTRPSPITYRSTGKSSDREPIIFHEAPRLNILSTSSRDWLFNALEEADVTGGFIPRFIFVDLPTSQREVPAIPQTNPDFVLLNTLRAIDELRGEAIILPEATVLYREWYHRAKLAADDHVNPALAGPFFRRMRRYVQKLAIIFEASKSQTLHVSVEAMKCAIRFADGLVATNNSLIETGMCRLGAELQKIEQYIVDGGRRGRKLSEITRRFQSMDARVRKAHLETLVQTDRVSRKTEPGEGRYAEIYFSTATEGRAEVTDKRAETSEAAEPNVQDAGEGSPILQPPA